MEVTEQSLIKLIETIDSSARKLSKRLNKQNLEINKLKQQNQRLKQNNQEVSEQIQQYIEELEKIRNYYVSSNHHSAR